MLLSVSIGNAENLITDYKTWVWVDWAGYVFEFGKPIDPEKLPKGVILPPEVAHILIATQNPRFSNAAPNSFVGEIFTKTVKETEDVSK